MNSEPLVDHSEPILRQSHFRGSDGVEDRRADFARRPRKLIVRLQVCAGLEFLRRIRSKRARGDEAACKTNGVHRDPAIGESRQIVRLDDRRSARIGAGGMGRAAALRPQVADADRYRRIGVHGLAEPVERQRLDMEFDIGGGVVGRGLGEQAELRGRHRHRPAPAKAIVEAHHRPLDPRLVVDIERARASDAEDGSQLQMVLQIFADPRQGMEDRRADCCETIRGADARKLQELRRADRAGGENDFAPGARLAADAVPAIAQACGAAALKQDALDMRAGRKVQVRPLQDRLQKRRRRAPAPAAALVDLEIARSPHCRPD